MKEIINVNNRERMSKHDWLLKLRRVRRVEILEIITEKKNYELNDADLAVFWGAVDHRLAELLTGKLFDRVPKLIWHIVR